MILNNPELKKYFWLNFSVLKLVMLPIALLMSCTVVYQISSDDTSPVLAFLLFVYYIFVLGGACCRVADSFSVDVVNKTWDFQKMSSMGPVSLAIGKIFGSTSYFLYAGALLLITMGGIVAFEGYGINNMFYILFPLVFGLLVGMVISFYLGLITGSEGKGGRFLGFIVGFFTAYEIASIGISMGDIDSGKILETSNETVKWFGYVFDHIKFVYASSAVIFFVSCLGIYQNLRQRLQYSDPPWVWIVTVLSLGGYLVGFAPTQFLLIDMVQLQLCTFFTLMICFSYVALTSEAYNLQLYKRFFYYKKKRNLLKMWENTPKWSVSLFFACVTFIAILASALVDDNKTVERLSGFLMGILLFSIRDGIVWHTICLNSRQKHKRFYLFCYYCFMYLIIPLFILVFSEKTDFLKNMYNTVKGVDGTGFFYYTHGFFMPSVAQNPLLSIAPVLLEISIAVYFLRKRNFFKGD